MSEEIPVELTPFPGELAPLILPIDNCLDPVVLVPTSREVPVAVYPFPGELATVILPLVDELDPVLLLPVVTGAPGAPGATGETGATGPTGPQGDPGAAGGGYYRHQQMLPAAVWTVTHNLNKYPSVSVVDSAETVVIGDVEYTSLNTCVLTFFAPFSGEAYFN